MLNSISHQQQKEKWEIEHGNPTALLRMDSFEGSSGVKEFVKFLVSTGKTNLKGLEMGCGKGRNVMYLAKQSQVKEMTGFDFSLTAIKEAKRRAEEANISNVEFLTMDATEPWQFESDSFDFVIDCFASTDIEDAQGRQFAIDEAHRVLKPGGFLLVYVLSEDDEYHKEIMSESPAVEKLAFIHPKTGKFEKVFSGEELDLVYKNFTLLLSKRIEKTAEFFGKSYNCLHHWRVYQK
ncbi:MAG TPA: class I SAM-dependent methyltransferase [Candidatus Paceibacterota bacterium]|nr:class I SAM-dependent methyltransferase [Candidatus Paceibacterota bacterium]